MGVIITILSDPSSTRSMAPCQGKYFCESPPDYPALIIRNLLKNNNFPQGLFKNQDISQEEENTLETLHKNIVVDSIKQQLGDSHESEEIYEAKRMDKYYPENERIFSGDTGKHSQFGEIITF